MQDKLLLKTVKMQYNVVKDRTFSNCGLLFLGLRAEFAINFKSVSDKVVRQIWTHPKI